jgi:putative ABC transport system permease protein
LLQNYKFLLNWFSKTKEISIGKFNGTTNTEIRLLHNKDFIRWVAIAFVIATPIAYTAMNKWQEPCLQNKTRWIFALAGLLALGITSLTISFQSCKAASRNPVEALRYE